LTDGIRWWPTPKRWVAKFPGINLKMSRLPHPKSKTNVQKQSLKTQKLIWQTKVTFMAQILPHCPMIFWNWMMLSQSQLLWSLPECPRYAQQFESCDPGLLLHLKLIAPRHSYRAFQSWHGMDCHLVPTATTANISSNNPCIWTCLWVVVWCTNEPIGILSKVKNNVMVWEIESTYMRAWWKMIIHGISLSSTQILGKFVRLTSVSLGFPFARTRPSYTLRMRRRLMPYLMQWKEELKLSAREVHCSTNSGIGYPRVLDPIGELCSPTVFPFALTFPSP